MIFGFCGRILDMKKINLSKNLIFSFLLLFSYFFLSQTEESVQAFNHNENSDKQNSKQILLKIEDPNQNKDPSKSSENQSEKDKIKKELKCNLDYFIIIGGNRNKKDFFRFYSIVNHQEQENELYISKEINQVKTFSVVKILVEAGESISFEESKDDKILFGNKGSKLKEYNGSIIKTKKGDDLIVKCPYNSTIRIIGDQHPFDCIPKEMVYPNIKLQSSVDINLELEGISADITGKIKNLRGKIPFLKVKDLEIKECIELTGKRFESNNFKASKCILNTIDCRIFNTSSKKCIINSNYCKAEGVLIEKLKINCNCVFLLGKFESLIATFDSGELDIFIDRDCAINSSICSGILSAKEGVDIKLKGIIEDLQIKRESNKK